MNKKAIQFIVFTIIFILILSYITYELLNKKHKKDNNGKKMPIMTFINGVDRLPHWHDILFGMVFGLVFGFLDNFFLFYGIETLNTLMPKDPIIQAGLGNTISDGVGSIIGTYLAIIGKHFYKYDDDNTPIWATTVGIIFGCLLGLYIPYHIKMYLK